MKIKLLVMLIALCIYHVVLAQPLSFAPKGIGGGGALFFPTFNPANDNEFYVSCDMSELFHTTDYGKTYNSIHQLMNLPITQILHTVTLMMGIPVTQ